MRRITRMAWMAIAAALIATGCYESPDFTWYEAGEYKGASDPLLEKMNDADFDRQLSDRLRQVQIDR